MNIRNLNHKNKAVAAFFLLSCTPISQASGYHFGTQSVSSQSTANASTAEAADASTIFYNPAGITHLKGTHFSLNANLVMPNIRYKNATAKYPKYAPVNVIGSNSGKITKDIIAVPHLYASHQLNDKWTLGLGIYVPFASGTEYDRDSVLRYNLNKMGVTSIDINPTLAYQINKQHSVAVGLVGQYITAELRQYSNLGLLGVKKNGIDAYGVMKGNDWGLGYTLGYLWDINEHYRVGLSYRSSVKHKLKGDVRWHLQHPAYANPNLSAGVRNAGYVSKEDGEVDITTPESLSLHGMMKLNDRWTTFGDVTWTRHSQFKEMNLKYQYQKVVGNAARKTTGCVSGTGCAAVFSKQSNIQPNWRDTYKVGLGASYQYSDDLQLRFGVAYDQSPIKSEKYRLSTLPDNDRIWFSLGAKYDINKNSSLNLGYSYIHIKDAKAKINGWCGSLNPKKKNCVSSRTDGQAEFKSHAHIFGVQYNYQF